MICEADIGRSKGIVEPFVEVAIGEQVEPDHGDEIRHGKRQTTPYRNIDR